MPPRPPVAIVRLTPARLARGRFALARAAVPPPPPRAVRPLARRLALTGPERRFARALLARRPERWLFRTRQGAGAGDFLLIDMSAGDPVRRAVAVLELKEGAALRPGGGLQVARAGAAVALLARPLGLVAPGAAWTPLTGGPTALLGALARTSHERALDDPA